MQWLAIEVLFHTTCNHFWVHWVNHFACIRVQSRISLWSNLGGSTVQVGGLTHLPLWKNITNYLLGWIYETTCIPHHLLYSIIEICCTNVKPLFLAKSSCFHRCPYIYLRYCHLCWLMNEGYIKLRHVDVIRFVFHVFQLLPLIITPKTLCYTRKSIMEHLQKPEWKSSLPWLSYG
jgi:hypothetical protein